MRIIDADKLPEHKFTRESAKGSDYMRGWNDAIDAIIDNAPTVETKKIEHKAYNDGFKDGVDQGIKLSERLQGEIIKELWNCRDELCLRCGKYQDAWKGACNDCRYNFENMEKWKNDSV